MRAETVARSGREPAQAHLLSIGEAAVRLVRGTRDGVERELRLDFVDLVRLEELGLQAESLEHPDVAATGVDQPLGHGEQVAAPDVPRVGHAYLVLPVHDRLRAGHGQPGCDGIRVVPAHHRERPAGIPAARHSAVEQRDRAGAVAAQGVGGRQPEDARADDRRVDGGHRRTVPRPCTS